MHVFDPDGAIHQRRERVKYLLYGVALGQALACIVFLCVVFG